MRRRAFLTGLAVAVAVAIVASGEGTTEEDEGADEPPLAPQRR